MTRRSRRSGLTYRVAVSAAGSAAGLIVVFALLALAVENLRGQTNERRDAQQVRLAADQLQTSVLDLETGLRAYLITRQERFLEPWRAARGRFPDELRRLGAAIGSTERTDVLAGALRVIRSDVESYFFDYSLPLVLRAQTERLPMAALRRDIAEGKERVDRLRGHFERLFDAQAEILTSEEREARAAAEVAFTVAPVGLLLLLAAALAQVLYIRSAVTGPVSRVASAAGALAAGRLTAEQRVTGLVHRPAREIHSLTESFDTMAAAIRQQTNRLEGHNTVLERRVRERTGELEQARYEALLMLAIAAEYRDDDTHRHTQRVGRNAALIGEQLALSPGTLELLEQAAPLHDVGKIGISDSIMLKPGRLTAEEFDAMKQHTVIGASILGSSSEPLFHVAAQIAYTHHERWDGSGYPEGLSGTAIPLAGRIVAVVDVFDALTHARPYKEAWPVERARDEIRRSAGSHFDPDVVAAFEALDPDILLADVAADEARQLRAGAATEGT